MTSQADLVSVDEDGGGATPVLADEHEALLKPQTPHGRGHYDALRKLGGDVEDSNQGNDRELSERNIFG